MFDKFKSVAFKLGIDKAIIFTSATRIVGGLGGLVSVLFVAHYLTGVEQGFYYTFGSILAIQVFFDLGLNGVITQYVAHEASFLVKNGNIYTGDLKHLSRLASLLHFCIKWFATISGFLFLFISAAGILFFTKFYKADNNVSWLVPWLLLSLGTSLDLLISPVLAFMEGLGKVKEIAKLRLIQQFVNMTFIWGGLWSGAKLYVGGISAIIIFTVGFIFVLKEFKSEILHIWKVKVVEAVNYRLEIFPYQWKVALSWISGYFIFQLFNPVLFATRGPIVAGQMGMTLVALNAIMSLSISWITTKIPVFSGMIAQKQYKQLDTLFNRTLRQSSAINIFALISMFLVIFIIRYFNIQVDNKNFGDRFLPYLPLFFMMIPVVLNNITGSWAVYLRCHKQEPMMILSIIVGILCSMSTIILGKYYGLMGITMGYTCIMIGSFLCTYHIYTTKKGEWHQ
jgi:O-antigen/teichoic acid export membrane protein